MVWSLPLYKPINVQTSFKHLALCIWSCTGSNELFCHQELKLQLTAITENSYTVLTWVTDDLCKVQHLNTMICSLKPRERKGSEPLLFMPIYIAVYQLEIFILPLWQERGVHIRDSAMECLCIIFGSVTVQQRSHYHSSRLCWSTTAGLCFTFLQRTTEVRCQITAMREEGGRWKTS